MKNKLTKAKPNLIEYMMSTNVVGPWPEQVESNALMIDCLSLINKYIVISEHAALAAALWIVNAYCADSFARCPLLLINAPERECGKTQLLKVIEKMVFRPLETTNITLAALFRVITNYKPVLLIDEADTFMDGKAELAGVVNKGYERGGVVLRVESDGNEFIERAYEVYGPKVMAGIMLERHLPSATMSRGIQIPLKRKTKSDTVHRLRSADPQVFATLRSKILRFVLENKESFEKGWDEMPEQLSDRDQDNWESLLAIAHCFGPHWYQKACEAAVQNCAETAPPQSSANQLLEDIREVLNTHDGKYIPSAELLEKLNSNPDMDWCTYNRGQPLTARQLAKSMGSYGIKPKTVRMKDGTTPKGYEARCFDDAFKRYLPEPVVEPTVEEKVPLRIGKPPIPNF